jgi:thiamine-monophosphate kinase
MKMLKENLRFDAESDTLLRQAHLKPVPRVKEGQELLWQGVEAAIDISDGLIADLTHICEASNVGALINEHLVPIHPVLKTHFPDNSHQLALTGGEDYELLFTAQEDIMERVKDSISCQIYLIGEITGEEKGRVIVTDREGKRVLFEQSGWEHF